MKLFLTSSGLPQEYRQEFINFIDKDLRDLSVGFIANGADLDENNWYVDKAKNELKEIGLKFEDVDLRHFVGKSSATLQEVLSKFDMIYVNGGDTFYLLDLMRKVNFEPVIRDLLNNGKIYFGTSAGSVVAGPNIELAGWPPNSDENVVNMKDTTGLSLVDFAILPHFESKDIDIVQNETSKISYPLIMLTNLQAVVVQGKDVRMVGES